MTTLYALGLGVGTQNSKGEWLEAFFPQPLLNPDPVLASVVAETLDFQSGKSTFDVTPEHLRQMSGKVGELNQIVQALQDSRKPLVAVLLADDEGPDREIGAFVVRSRGWSAPVGVVRGRGHGRLTLVGRWGCRRGDRGRDGAQAQRVGLVDDRLGL